jgi:hypothetical protein
MSVRLVQCLCPNRHAIIAIAYAPGVTSAGDITLDQSNAAGYMKGMFQRMVGNGSLNAVCGICGATEFSYEDAPTKYETMDEALPALKEVEQRQRATRATIDEMRRAQRN